MVGFSEGAGEVSDAVGEFKGKRWRGGIVESRLP
jgi:hypothetical protein